MLGRAPTIDGWKLLDPVLVIKKIGGGGMGSVYFGRHLNLDIEVAVKCLDHALASRDREFVARFQREAKVAASINHQNLIHVYDVAQNHGIHYLVMEFVSGETVSRRVRRKGPLPELEALRIFRDAARGLAAAHKKGIVHRDVKPDNILISADGDVKVADLGLAKAFDEKTDAMTSTNVTLGTPQYMPPEQWEDVRLVGPATDVYALAHTLYFMLTGREAWSGKSIVELAKRIATEDFPDPADLREGLSSAVRELIARCTARDPKKRPADAAAAADLVDRAFHLPELDACTAAEDDLSERPTNFMPSAATIERARTAMSKVGGGLAPTVAMTAEKPAVQPTMVDRPRMPAAPPPRVMVSSQKKAKSGLKAAAALFVVAAAAVAGVLYRPHAEATEAAPGIRRTEAPAEARKAVSEPSADPGAESAAIAAESRPDRKVETESAPAAAAEVSATPAPPAAESAAKPAEGEAVAEEAPPEEIRSPRDGAVYRRVRLPDGGAIWVAETETTVRAFRLFAATVPDDPETAEAPADERTDGSAPEGDDPPPPEEGAPERRPGPPEGPGPLPRPRRGPPPREGMPPGPPEGGPERTRRPVREALEGARRQRRDAAAAGRSPLPRVVRQMLMRQGEDEPAINMPIAAIRLYAQWVAAGLAEGGITAEVRLPTSAEWRAAAGSEIAADAIYPLTGADDTGLSAPGRDLKGGANWNGRSLVPVKSFRADRRGFYDLLGNAAEITDDGEAEGLRLMGGSFWTTDRAELRLDHVRAYRPPEPFSSAAGFRLIIRPR